MTGPEPFSHGPPGLRDEAHAWLLRLTSGQATRRDAEDFRQWCAQSVEHAAAFQRAWSLWQALGPASAHYLRGASETRHLPGRRFGRRALLGGALAASVAALLLHPALPLGLGAPGADFRTAVGEQRRVELARGLTLELNTRTRINRRPLEQGVPAIELLDGEVEVLATAPLRVRAGAGTLLAETARFNIRTQDDTICVACLEGSLELQLHGGRTSLSGGRRLVYDQRLRQAPEPFDPALVTAWRQQLLVFDDAPLAQVIDEINRYRPGMILLVNQRLGQRKVQARFRLHQLGEIGQLIRNAYGATVTELPGGVILVS